MRNLIGLIIYLIFWGSLLSLGNKKEKKKDVPEEEGEGDISLPARPFAEKLRKYLIDTCEVHLTIYECDKLVEYADKHRYNELSSESNTWDKCVIDIENECFLIIYNGTIYHRPFKLGDMEFNTKEIESADYWHCVGTPTKGIKVGDIDPDLKDINIWYDEDGEFDIKKMGCSLSNLMWDASGVYFNAGDYKNIPVELIEYEV